MSADAPEKPPVTAYQMTLTWIPSTGEFDYGGPAERAIAYSMLELARERLTLVAMQLEMAAQKKRLVTGMNN